MKKIFIGGSRAVSWLDSKSRAQIEFRLQRVIADGDRVLVGDAKGVDSSVQNFFREKYYDKVTVYCMDENCRSKNIGDDWEIKHIPSNGTPKGFAYFAMKDKQMSDDADYGFMIWDGKSKGTLNNLKNLVNGGKSAEVYFAPKREVVEIKTAQDIDGLLGQESLIGGKFNIHAVQTARG